MELFGNKKVAKIATSFQCVLCDYITSKKCNYDKHVLTPKHQNRLLWKQLEANGNTKVAKVAKNEDEYFCTNCKCKKLYKTRAGMWKHNNKCVSSDIIIDTETILDIMKQNQEFKQLLVEQYQESQKIQEIQNQKIQELQYKQNQDLQQHFFDLAKQTIGTNNNIITLFLLTPIKKINCGHAATLPRG